MASTPQTILNLTPHDIRVYVNWSQPEEAGGTIVTYPAAKGGAVRLQPKKQEHLGDFDNGVPVYSPLKFEGVLVGFPFYENKDYQHQPDIIVTVAVSTYIPSRYRGNVFTPDTGPDSVVRDGSGKIVGVKRLCFVPQRDRF